MMRKRLIPIWLPALLALGLLILSACKPQAQTTLPAREPVSTLTSEAPADGVKAEETSTGSGQLQFIEFYSPL